MSDAAPGPNAAAGRPPAPAPLREEARTGLLVLVGVVLLGAPLGLLWAAVAPRPDLVRQDGGGLAYADLETKDFIAADGLLFLLGAAAGLLVAVAAWRYGRLRPLGTVLGLVAGAGLASYVAWRTGVLVDDREALLAAARDPMRSAPIDLPLELRSKAALLGWPAAAAVTFAHDRPAPPARPARVGRPRAPYCGRPGCREVAAGGQAVAVRRLVCS